MSKIGLVLEGGGMRGLYTAGVLDVLMKNNIEVDGIIGVSAGALFGANYFSKQIGRSIRYNKKYCKDKRYISIYSLLTTGNIVNKDFAYYKITNDLDKFDDVTFKKLNKDYYVVVTNVKTGDAEYKNIKNGVIDNLEVLRASSSMPFVSKMISIDNKEYLDGAIADSIPYEKLKEIGYDKIIVILTRDYEYRKKPYNRLLKFFISIKYRKYPLLIDKIINRYKNYNESIKKLIEYENNGEIFVIRPSEKIMIKRLEHNETKLQDVYDLGTKDMKNNLDKIYKFLNK